MATINRFDLSAINNVDYKRLGMYFTSNINYAKTYGENIIGVNLSINNPFDARTENPNGYVHARSFVNTLPISNKLKSELSMGINETLAYGLLEGALREDITETLKELGYDGIVFNEAYAETWIPFYEDQIQVVSLDEAEFFHGSDDAFEI